MNIENFLARIQAHDLTSEECLALWSDPGNNSENQTIQRIYALGGCLKTLVKRNSSSSKISITDEVSFRNELSQGKRGLRPTIWVDISNGWSFCYLSIESGKAEAWKDGKMEKQGTWPEIRDFFTDEVAKEPKKVAKPKTPRSKEDLMKEVAKLMALIKEQEEPKQEVVNEEPAAEIANEEPAEEVVQEEQEQTFQAPADEFEPVVELV